MELNDKMEVLLETPEELEAEILDAEELDSLIVEKVCVTDNIPFYSCLLSDLASEWQQDLSAFVM